MIDLFVSHYPTFTPSHLHTLTPSQNAALAVVNTGGVDGRKVVVSGGSHGGFLTAHLVAQFPVS